MSKSIKNIFNKQYSSLLDDELILLEKFKEWRKKNSNDKHLSIELSDEFDRYMLQQERGRKIDELLNGN
jgi:hypothetical protein